MTDDPLRDPALPLNRREITALAALVDGRGYPTEALAELADRLMGHLDLLGQLRDNAAAGGDTLSEDEALYLEAYDEAVVKLVSAVKRRVDRQEPPPRNLPEVVHLASLPGFKKNTLTVLSEWPEGGGTIYYRTLSDPAGEDPSPSKEDLLEIAWRGGARTVMMHGYTQYHRCPDCETIWEMHSTKIHGQVCDDCLRTNRR